MCGVVAVIDKNAAKLAIFALHALQHRGQESCGVAISNGTNTACERKSGLITGFTESDVHELKGELAIGHTRYPTAGGAGLRDAQPIVIETKIGTIALAQNGNITNALKIREKLLGNGVGLTTANDGELLIQLLAGMSGGITERLTKLMSKAKGAYSLVLMTNEAIYGIRDRHGFRPLNLGRTKEGYYMLASETCAITTVEAKFVREIEPGEIVKLNHNGISSTRVKTEEQSYCSFENIYFSRPDHVQNGHMVHQIRQLLGVKLAQEHPIEADCVAGAPLSGIPMAIGYANETRIPYTEFFVQNRYIGRTFIKPDNNSRKEGVRLKFNVLSSNIYGKDIVLIDDSIVRGNTSKVLVEMLRESGANSIHIRVASPPIRHPCFMGIDMPTHEELIAQAMTKDEIMTSIDADSLEYISVGGMMEVMNSIHNGGYCDACFTGNYPVKIYTRMNNSI